MTASKRDSGRLLSMGKAALFAFATAGVLYLATGPDNSAAADKGDSPTKAGTSELDYVPGGAVAVVSVRVADLMNHPAAKGALGELGKGMPEILKHLREGSGVSPEEVERLTVILLSLQTQGPNDTPVVVVAVTTVKPYDQKAILATAAPDAKTETVYDRPFHRSLGGPSFCFLDDRTFLAGGAHQLEEYLKWPEGRTEGPLTPALRLAAAKHFAVVGVDVTAFAKAAPPPEAWPPDAKRFKALMKARLATLTVDLDEQVRADLRLTFATEAEAKAGAAAADGGLDLMRGGFSRWWKEFSKVEDVEKVKGPVEEAQAVLKGARAEQKGETVEITAAIKLDPETTAAALTAGAFMMKKAAQRISILNDLKQLALAVHSYNDANGIMPAAANFDENGKPLLSWRVFLLPYIEGGNLYNQFHLKEPWDSEHNKKLLEKMPAWFAGGDEEALKKHETYFQAFVGKGTVFEPKDKPKAGPIALGLRLPADIPDGLSNTILFVEAAKSVPWTKPEDIPFDEGKLLPKVGGLKTSTLKSGFMAAFCDGSVRLLPLTMKEETLRALVTRNGGEEIPDLDK